MLSFYIFSFDQVLNIIVVDSIFDIDFFNMHYFKYANDRQVQNFLRRNCFKFTNVMNNTTVINTFNGDNGKIAKIQTHYH